MKKGLRIVHWLTTGLVCILFTASALTYILNHDEVSETFLSELGFPAWLVYPMAVAKLAAVVMLLTKFNKALTEWAYAGLVFNMLLAIGAHTSTGDPQFVAPVMALILIIGSYLTWKQKKKLGLND